MKPQLSAVLGIICFVLGGALTLIAHGGTSEDVSLLGRTLALAGAVIIAGALISDAIRLNAGKH